MILHQFPMYIRYSFAWYGWYSPKIDRGTHIFRYEIELDPREAGSVMTYVICRLVSCMSVSRATIIVLSSVFDAHHHQTYTDHEYSA